MALIKLNCPNCNGKLEYKEGQAIKCPYCETELLVKEKKVYYINQTINNYCKRDSYSTDSAYASKIESFTVVNTSDYYCGVFRVFYVGDTETDSQHKVEARTMPESEVLLFFLKDIFNKGDALPTKEEIATIRYFSARNFDEQWHFEYSFDDPFSNEQAEISSYIMMDKLLNKQRIEQKDFEAFTGLTKLKLDNEYEIQQSDQISFEHLKGLKAIQRHSMNP